jgi:hypothetical protein
VVVVFKCYFHFSFAKGVKIEGVASGISRLLVSLVSSILSLNLFSV